MGRMDSPIARANTAAPVPVTTQLKDQRSRPPMFARILRRAMGSALGYDSRAPGPSEAMTFITRVGLARAPSSARRRFDSLFRRMAFDVCTDYLSFVV